MPARQLAGKIRRVRAVQNPGLCAWSAKPRVCACRFRLARPCPPVTKAQKRRGAFHHGQSRCHQRAPRHIQSLLCGRQSALREISIIGCDVDQNIPCGSIFTKHRHRIGAEHVARIASCSATSNSDSTDADSTATVPIVLTAAFAGALLWEAASRRLLPALGRARAPLPFRWQSLQRRVNVIGLAPELPSAIAPKHQKPTPAR